MASLAAIARQSIDYDAVEEAFLDLIEDLGIAKFPINCFYVASRLKIGLVKYSSCPAEIYGELAAKYEDGFSLLRENQQYCIFYNDYMLKSRMRFTIWYEIGHIALGHFSDTSKSDCLQKQECNCFATFAQSPMAFVLLAGPESPSDLAGLFGISYQSASYVFEKYLHVMERPSVAKKILNGRIAKLLEFDIEELRLT